MSIMETITRHLPHSKTRHFDVDAAAREHSGRMMGLDLTLEERLEKSRRLTPAAPSKRPLTHG